MKHFLLMAFVLAAASSWAQKGFELKEDAKEKRVEVTYDGFLLTAYMYSDSLMKPVLYPIYSPGGIRITRDYPLVTTPGERGDHPHHGARRTRTRDHARQPDRSAVDASSPGGTRRTLRVSGLRSARGLVRRPPPQVLGRRRTDETRELGPGLRRASPEGPRRGLDARATRRTLDCQAAAAEYRATIANRLSRHGQRAKRSDGY